MSSEKPFWEGKTLMEIQNLDKRVKVTMENGDVFIGKLVRRSRDTDGICSLSMQSDYKQRMIREHRELQERIIKLAHMLEGYAEGTLDFTPACSFQLLESQLYAMETYANILQERARIEQVDLNAPLEGGESGEVSQD